MPNATRGFGLLERFLAERRMEKANSLIDLKHRRGRVLDIGSGSHPFFLLNTNFLEKFGVDQLISENDKQKYRKEKINLFQFDINSGRKLEFDDDYFDCVIMLAVVEHLREKDLLVLLREIYRVLKNKGYFIYTTPAPWTGPLFKLLPTVGLLSKDEAGEHKEYYSSNKMKKNLVEAGFSDSKMEFGYFEMFLNTWGRAEK